MQYEELKAARSALGLTQEELAQGLGMSRKAINEMEAGKAAIEKRTELAVRQLFNQRSRLYGAHRVEPLSDDVALKDASILWDRYGEVSPPVLVLGREDDDQRYPSSYGACNSDWNATDDVGRLLRLLTRFVELTVADRIPARKVHKAFSVIPEYRYALSEGMFDQGIADR
jgi:DNA-binding XRE family transcriptional regulator